MRDTLIVIVCAGALCAASPSQAQDLAVPTEAAPIAVSSDQTSERPVGEPRGLFVEIAEPEAQVAGPPGVTLSLIAQTPGVPVVLHALRGTETRPVAALIVENRSPQLLTALAVSVTWTPADGLARRRVVTLAIAIPAGETRRVMLGDTEAAQRLMGAQGVLEVAPVGASAVDGTRWMQSPGYPWATGGKDVACADAGWEAQVTGTDLPDPTSGAIVRCEADGRWTELGDAERDR